MWDRLLEILGGNVFKGVGDIISKFVTDPTERARLEAELATKELEVKIAVLKYESEDRTSARAREMAVKDKVPAVLAYGVTVGFFSILGYMLKFGLPATGAEALLIMLGSLGTAWVAIVSYYFGSSAGSQAKDSILGKFVNK